MGQILEIAPNPCRVSIWVDNHDHPKKSNIGFDIQPWVSKNQIPDDHT
jgi:hypothetical protein